MSAGNDIKLLCETILHFDEEGLKKFNFSREDLYTMWTKSFIEAIEVNMKSAFSEKHAKKIGDAIISALKKVSIDTKDLAEEKVEVTVTGLSVGSIFVDQNWQLDVKPDAKPEEIVSSVVRTVEKKFETLQPVQTTVFVIDCNYSKDGKIWMPISMDNFMSQLFAGTLGKK